VIQFFVQLHERGNASARLCAKRSFVAQRRALETARELNSRNTSTMGEGWVKSGEKEKEARKKELNRDAI